MNTDATGLAGIDYAIVLLYLGGVLLIGTYFGRYVRTSRDFFLAGKALPFWAVGMSIVVSDIGATDFIAVTAGSYKHGLAQANFDWLGSMPALVIVAFLFMPYYWRSGVFSIPEFLGRRYNSAVQLFSAICWGLILILTLGIMLYATAVLLEEVLGWPQSVSIWVTAIIVGVYTLTGGLAAVVMTDTLQLVIMFVGGGALSFRVVHEVGGLAAMKEQILARGPAFADHVSLYLPHDTAAPFPWTGIVLGLGVVLSTAYYAGNQAVAQRALGARSEWDAKAGLLWAGFLKMFIPLLVVIPGLAAIVIAPDLDDSAKAMPMLIRTLLPAGLRGLMFAAFLAALMSSVDSNLNSASTLWTCDIVGKISGWMGRPFTEKTTLVFGRIFGGVLLLAAVLVAPQIGKREDDIYTIIQTIYSIVQGPSLAILLLGILWRGTTQWGALAGLVCGVALTLTLTSESMQGLFPSNDPYLFISWWSFVFSLIVTVVISLVTPKDPDEKIRGLVFGSVLHDDEMQGVLKERVQNR